MNKKIIGHFLVITSALAALSIIAVIFYLLASSFWHGKDYLSWEFLTTAPTDGMTAGGIFPAIVGTFLLVLVMSVAGVPIGVVTAVFLNEYAQKGSFFTRSIRFAVSTLAGVPSIVFGLFGVGFFIRFVGVNMDRFLAGGELRWGQPGLLWAGLTMAFLTLPVVIVSVEEALRAVPDDLRAASLALGATKAQTIAKVVLPNAAGGIMTGTILAVGRGAGEVAPILFTGAAYFLPHLPKTLSDQFMNLGYHVYIMATQSPDVEATKGLQYATVLILLLLTFGMNFTAVIFRYRLRKSQQH